MDALRFENVSFAYGSRNFSLSGVSFALPDEGFVTVLGANGAGKTTLFRLACGLLQPTNGTITVLGRNITTLERREAARMIAFVAQHAPPSIAITVEEYVMLGRIPFSGAFAFRSLNDERATEEAMELTDCNALRTAKLDELSGGELQRALVARAIAQKPKILVLDEPNSHLDVAHQLALFRALQSWRERTGGMVIASTHDLNLASMFGAYSLILAGGKLVASGTPEEVFTSAIIERVFAVKADVIHGYYGAAPAVQLRAQ